MSQAGLVNAHVYVAFPCSLAVYEGEQPPVSLCGAWVGRHTVAVEQPMHVLQCVMHCRLFAQWHAGCTLWLTQCNHLQAASAGPECIDEGYS